MNRNLLSISLLGVLVAALLLVSAGSAQAGEQMQSMIRINKNLINVFKRNVTRCDKCVKEVKAFHKKNIANFKRMKKLTKAHLKGLSEAQKKSFGQRYAKQIMSMYGELMQTAGKFQQKCPKHGKKLTKVFEDFSLN